MPTLSIPDDTYRRLAARAAEQHTTVDNLASRLLAEATGQQKPGAGGVLDYLDSLPAVARTADEWAEYDRAVLDRRAEWGH